jgi:GT2 family glycosyltransferase
MKATCGWFGYGGNSWQADKLRDSLAAHDIKLLTCHEYPNADVTYNSSTINEFIDRCDFMILPARHTVQPGKGVNRLAISWSRGKACVIAPLDSYLQYAKHEFNALIAETDGQMIGHAVRLRDNLELRSKLGQNGKETAINHLHPRDLITKLMKSVKRQKVAIIIPHYADDKRYLAEAVKSAMTSRGPQREVFVVSSSKISPSEVLKGFPTAGLTLIESDTRLSFSEANNKVLKDPRDFTHFLLLNDDAILSTCALERMLEVCPEDALLNPWSNCDKSWLHHDDIRIGGISLTPGMTIDGVAPILNEIHNHQNVKDTGLVKAPFCAMYATLIPIKVLKAVGLLDEKFKNGGEDADYCYRAKELGFNSYWTRNAFVFHFGGKTRKFSETQNYKSHHEEDAHNNEYLKKKWAKKKPVVGIWTGPAWEKWDIDSPYTTGIGGSETCAAKLAETFVERGCQVHLIGHHDTKVQRGVELIDWTKWNANDHHYNLFVASRNLSPVSIVKADKIVAWVHDIFLLSGTPNAEVNSKVHKYLCLSPWHKQFFHNYHGLPLEKIDIVPNGIDTSIYAPGEKVFGKMHYSSSPDRGLDNIIYCLPYIRDHVPEIHLDVYYGFHNWVSAAKSRNNSDEMAKIDALQKDIEKCADIVNFKDRVNQKDLAKAWGKAYVWGYPTQFTETFCLTALEAQLTATPIVCSNVAALETTVGAAGHLITQNPYSKEGRQEFVDEIVKLHKNKDYWLKMSENSVGVKSVDWNSRYNDYWSKYL